MAIGTISEPLQVGIGSISAKDFRLPDAQKLVEAITKHYMVSVGDEAHGCCIDGRPCSHTLAGTATQPGPSISGGPTLTCYAAAELVGDWFGGDAAASVSSRITHVNNVLRAAAVVVGAHVSAAALESTAQTFVNPTTRTTQTGCGAMDGFSDIMAAMSAYKDSVEAVAEVLLPDYSPTSMQFVDIGALSPRLESYDPLDVLQPIRVEANGAQVEVLEGAHAEVLVVFNYVPNTTVDRDQLVSDTDQQVFVVDMWYLDKLAHAMAADGDVAAAMYARLKHAMTAFQIATYIALCDGTHRAVMIHA